MKIYLETPRLILRELDFADENNILELDSDPEVMQYLTNGIATSREDARSALNRTKNLFEKHSGNFGFWAAIEKESGMLWGGFFFGHQKLIKRILEELSLAIALRRLFGEKGMQLKAVSLSF
jgi:RimJ/RimL family protein N-acetyltransferase